MTSASLSGTAAVLVTVHEEFGINQTAVVHVEVQYLFVNFSNLFNFLSLCSIHDIFTVSIQLLFFVRR